MATNAELLVEAEAAYHSLMIGGAVRVVVDRNGERVEFTSANSKLLYGYIQELKRLIDLEGGLRVPRGPAGVIF